jgi:hypothetical protein
MRSMKYDSCHSESITGMLSIFICPRALRIWIIEDRVKYTKIEVALSLI